MNEKIKEQLLKICDLGAVNMFDRKGVQRLAFDLGYFDLVNYIEEHPKEYAHFILYGTESGKEE